MDAIVKVEKGKARNGPESLLAVLQHEVDGALERFARSLDPFAAPRVSPRLNYGWGDKDVELTLELPGLAPSDINLRLDGSILTISGEKADSTEPGREYVAQERSHGAFSRTVSLPAHVKPADIRARLVDGVLTITAPLATRRRDAPVEISVTRG